MASREVKVAILGDAASFDKAFQAAGQSASDFDKKITTTSQNLKKFGDSAQTIGKSMSLAITAPIAAIAAVGFNELAQAQKAMAQTEAVLRSTGEAANVTSKQVVGLANSLSQMSGIDDEVIQGGENVLLTFTRVRNEVGKGNDVFNQATKAALNMSVALGTDLQSASIVVGKALNDPIAGLTALRRVGVQFTQAQRDQIAALVETGDVMGAQKVILQELTTEFGGSAKAFGETLPGQVAKAKNAFDEMSASLLVAALPAILAITNALQAFFGWVQNLPGPVKVFVTGLAAIAAVAGPAIYIMGTLAKAIENIIEQSAPLAAGFGRIGSAVAGALPALVGFGAIFAAGALIASYTGKLYDLGRAVTELGRVSDQAQVKLFALSAAQVALDHNTSLANASMKVFQATAQSSVGTAQRLIDNLKAQGVNTDVYEAALQKEIKAQERANTAAQSSTDIYDEQTGAIDDATAAFEKNVSAITDQANASLSSQGAAVAMDRAIQTLNDTLKDHTADTLESRDATIQAEQSIVNFGQKIYDEKAALGDSEGALRAQIDALSSVASTLAPGSQLRTFLDQYIDQLQHQIPSQVYTDFILRLSNETGLSVQDLRDLRDISNVYSFAEGGLVPGATGAPHMAIVHGGEFVVPAAQAAAFRTPGAVTPIRTVTAAQAPTDLSGGGTQVIQLVVSGRVLAEVTAAELSRAGGPQIASRAIA